MFVDENEDEGIWGGGGQRLIGFIDLMKPPSQGARDKIFYSCDPNLMRNSLNFGPLEFYKCYSNFT
jgi:hypothetical protein